MDLGELLACVECEGEGHISWATGVARDEDGVRYMERDHEPCRHCHATGIRADLAHGDWASLDVLCGAVEGGEAIECGGVIEPAEIALYWLVRWMAGRELTWAERGGQQTEAA